MKILGFCVDAGGEDGKVKKIKPEVGRTDSGWAKESGDTLI